MILAQVTGFVNHGKPASTVREAGKAKTERVKQVEQSINIKPYFFTKSA